MAPLTSKRSAWLFVGLLVCLLPVGVLLVQSQPDMELPFPPGCLGEDHEVVHEVTLNTLLNAPAKITCNGRWVRVRGFLVLEFEHNTLYESREAAEQDRWDFHLGRGTFRPPGLWASVSDELRRATARRFNQRNVVITGKFKAGPGGHMDGWPGEIGLSFIEFQSVPDMALPVPLVPINSVPPPLPPPPTKGK